MARSNIQITKDGKIYANEFNETDSFTYTYQYPFDTDCIVHGEIDEVSWSGIVNLGHHDSSTTQHKIIAYEFIEDGAE